MIDPIFVGGLAAVVLFLELRESWRKHCEFLEDFHARTHRGAEGRPIQRDRWF